MIAEWAKAAALKHNQERMAGRKVILIMGCGKVKVDKWIDPVRILKITTRVEVPRRLILARVHDDHDDHDNYDDH